MTPTRALGVQLLAVQIALQTAVQSVADAVERVQGTVDKILVLAQASQVGDVVGNHDALSRIAKVTKRRVRCQPPTGNPSHLSAPSLRLVSRGCASMPSAP